MKCYNGEESLIRSFPSKVGVRRARPANPGAGPPPTYAPKRVRRERERSALPPR